MTTIAHAISGSFIAIAATNTLPLETGYVALALVSASFMDIDHVVSILKNKKFYRENGWRGNLHNARTFLHELAGFFVIGATALAISFIDLKAAMIFGIAAMVHLTEDIIMGISIPFGPFRKMQINLVPQKAKLKIFADVLVISFFSFLWLAYLNGTN